MRQRLWSLPTIAVNLELLGQRGPYVLWDHDGDALRRIAIAPQVNALVRASVRQATGSAPQHHSRINSDAGSFLFAGIPAAVLGSADPALGVDGMHRPSDSAARVDPARTTEAAEILRTLIAQYDHGDAET